MADEMKPRGLSKLGPRTPGPARTANVSQDKAPRAPSAPRAEDETGVRTHTLEEHPDGHFESHMHDGAHENHPDHLHMLAHLGHHLSGGDRHHIGHHDGVTAATHAINDDGTHQDTQNHNSDADAENSFRSFLGQGGAPETASLGSAPEEAEAAPAFGGMGRG